LIFPLLHTAYGLGLLGGLLAPGLRYRQGAPLVVTLKALSSERSTAQRALDHAVATEAMDAG
jgi:hypothetical protein